MWISSRATTEGARSASPSDRMHPFRSFAQGSQKMARRDACSSVLAFLYPGATRRSLAWIWTENGPEELRCGIIRSRYACALQQVDRTAYFALSDQRQRPIPQFQQDLVGLRNILAKTWWTRERPAVFRFRNQFDPRAGVELL